MSLTLGFGGIKPAYPPRQQVLASEKFYYISALQWRRCWSSLCASVCNLNFYTRHNQAFCFVRTRLLLWCCFHWSSNRAINSACADLRRVQQRGRHLRIQQRQARLCRIDRVAASGLLIAQKHDCKLHDFSGMNERMINVPLASTDLTFAVAKR